MPTGAPGRSVLVIDSDDPRATLLGTFLRERGADVVRARDPEDGWRAFVEHRSSIVLAELSPHGRGDSFLRRLQGEYLGAMPRTFFVCALEDLALASALEPDGILVPPLSTESLMSVLDRHEAAPDSAARQATRLRELYEVSLLGPDLYRAIDILCARAAIAFQATDCVVWGSGDDPNLPRIARPQYPTDARVYLDQCKRAASGGVTVLTATGGEESDLIVARRGRSFLAAPLGPSGTASGGICLVSDDSRRFTTDERDALRVLARRTAHELAFVTAHRRLAAEQEKLRESALVDPLLGIWTRPAMEQAIVAQIASARRRGESLCLAVLDYLQLRAVNERFGHVIGDAALGHFAQTVRAHLRVQDMVGRLGGDEIAILLVGCDLAAARALVERTLSELTASPYQGGDVAVDIAATAGVAMIGHEESNMEAAVGRALEAVRRARRAGERIDVLDPERDWSPVSEVMSLGHDRGLPAGATLGGMYRILHEISRGAMGVVYRGEDLGLGRPVAIKVMRSDLAQDKELVGRFRDEASMLASLHHVNLVQVYAFGAEAEDVYFVMELVEGEPLSDVILKVNDAGEFIDLAAASKIVDEIADALEAIHALGIIHRDVKPANVLLDRINDRGVLVDVGVAKRREDATDAAGTPGFAAPESFMDENETTATDVYGLAATTYTMLTGTAPFGTGELVEMVNRQLYERPREPSLLRADLSPAVDEVLFKALAPNQDDRYESAAAFAIALSRALARLPSDDTTLPRRLRARRRSAQLASLHKLLLLALQTHQACPQPAIRLAQLLRAIAELHRPHDDRRLDAARRRLLLGAAPRDLVHLANADDDSHRKERHLEGHPERVLEEAPRLRARDPEDRLRPEHPTLGQRHPSQVLHHHVVATAVLSQLERLDDVRVIELRAEPRLVEEHPHELGIVGEVIEQALDDDVLLEPGLAADSRQVDLCRASDGEQGKHLVLA